MCWAGRSSTREGVRAGAVAGGGSGGVCGQHSRAPPSGAPGLEGRPGVLRQLFGAVLPAVSHGCHCCGRFLEGPAPATRAFLTGQAGRVTLWARPSLKLCTHGVPGGISEAAFPSTGDTVSSHAAGTRSLRARSGIGTAPSTRCRPSHVSLPTTCASRLLAFIQPRLRQVSHAAPCHSVSDCARCPRSPGATLLELLCHVSSNNMRCFGGHRD